MRRLRLVSVASAAVVVSGALLASAFTPVSAAPTGASSLSAIRAAVACTGPTWTSTGIYTKDMVVTYGGHSWTAKWWTQNEVPGTTGEWGVWVDNGACGTTTPPTTAPPTTAPPTTAPPTTAPPTTNPPTAGGKKVVGYFTEWGVYGRNYHVKNIETSGSAAKLTHILYAFGNPSGGNCSIGDSYADYDKAYTAADSVDGVADTWDAGALRGNFNQLRKLKKMHPGLKVIWSFGGWTWSGGFTQVAANPTAFANSCYNLVKDPRWADVFDGIDIDWEYPNACGLQCDASGRAGYPNLMKALRAKFGSSALVTSAITADGTSGGKIEAADYAAATSSVDFFMPMTYDYDGAFNPTSVGPHSPLTSFAGQKVAGFDSATAVAKLKSLGIPSSKILLGLGFYGRGWTGVTGTAPGSSATGAAPGTYEAGIEDYKVLKTRCPATGTVGGTAYAKCGSEWWSYDTPATIAGKMSYAKQQGLAGSFVWELSGDTTNGELMSAVKTGLG